jgi:hypothetical protein
MSEDLINEDVKPEAEVVETPAVVEETPVVEEAPAVVEEPVSAPEENTIVVEEEIKESKALAAVENGAIGSTTVKAKKAPAKPVVPATTGDTVAIRSTKNVAWQGVGKVSRGINIVTKAEADQWLTRNHVTLVSPEEVAKEYNK